MAPRMSQFPTQKIPNPASMKRSSYYQYEMEHGSFPLPNQVVITEDDMEDSPKNGHRHIRRLPSYDQQKDLGYISSRGGNARDRPYRNQQGLGQPSPKYSSIINTEDLKSRSKIFSSHDDVKKIAPYSSRNECQYGKQYYGGGGF